MLHDEFRASGEKFWVYECNAERCCWRCDAGCMRDAWRSASRFARNNSALCCLTSPYQRVQIPIKADTVGLIERSIHASSIASSGSDHRSHGTFISHLSTLECSEEYKQALCAWVPHAMMAFMGKQAMSARKFRVGYSERQDASQPAKSPKSEAGASEKAPEPDTTPPGNPDCEDGAMKGSRVEADAYGKEERITGLVFDQGPEKILARQIGPDLIPTEVMDSCASNLKAGAAKRVQPLPFKADKNMVRKIDRVVSAIMRHVFSEEKIKEWRTNNPCVDDFASKKWSASRWRNAFEEALMEVNGKIEQTFQIKINEALPAKDKAPRPIIQCGDKAQAMMNLPVKCFEELLFEHFEVASIKHLPKYDAMERVAKHLMQADAHIIEGDGSAWDACCNKKIRDLTENRILRYICHVLGNDHEVPSGWMEKVLVDMEKPKLRGKGKVSDFCASPIKVMIESIRQSGHRGTSCFNYLINLVCWLCVVCDEPELMIEKSGGILPTLYKSAHDGMTYSLKYAFEGDDSALSSTEDFSQHQEAIEAAWTKLGFRMKLVFVKQKMTFTGFDFECDKNGPTGVFLPEIVRNIASASWSCSSELKSFPERVHHIGAAAFLARAENFKDCGPLSRYFASIGLAHVRKFGDREIGEAEALSLGVHVSPSIRDSLQELYDSARPMSRRMMAHVHSIVPISREQELRMLEVHFEDPFDVSLARQVLPFPLWDPAQFSRPRRSCN